MDGMRRIVTSVHTETKKTAWKRLFYYQSSNQSIYHEFLEWPIYKYLKHYRSTINRSAECQDIWFREQERLESSVVGRQRQCWRNLRCMQAVPHLRVRPATKNARLSTVERWIRGWMTQSLQEQRPGCRPIRHSHALKSTEPNYVPGCL